VLTEPGLKGVVASIKEGRATFQRILTYTLRTVIHKIVQVLFLFIGLVLSGQAILTPLLMVLMMMTGDLLSMSSATDTVTPSPTPSVWRIGHLTVAGVVLGLVDLAFCVASFAVGKFVLGLDTLSLRTLTVVTLVFSGQAVFYVARERRRLWSSKPGKWLLISSVVDLGLFSVLASNGILMPALPVLVLVSLFGGALALALVLDTVKVALFRRMKIA
jgi:H+-transporting ATPase